MNGSIFLIASRIKNAEMKCLSLNAQLPFWHVVLKRKILTVAHPDLEGAQFDGAEVTFSQFEVTTEADLNALVNGEDVRISYCAD